MPAFNDCQTLADFEALFPTRALPAEADVVRIAPSPTGMPHIGTMMQSVIDRALAWKNGGIYMLRIEDTDRARLVEGAEQAIVDTLTWIGTRPDEGPRGLGGTYGPYVQSERLHLYQTAARHLVETGHAYHCFCTKERLDLVRREQERRGVTSRYDGHCKRLSKEEVQQRIAAGEPSVVRQAVPMDRRVTVEDVVRGRIVFDSSVVDDTVLLKSDGYPTYHLAVVVDDHFMRVTMVVRGEEWISSSPKHVLLYESFGWEAPRFLHTVLLRDAERRKLSKRSGDTSAAWFRAEGYVPAGITNFLTRVMWAHPEDKDIYDLHEFARLLDPSRLPATGPVADMKLLDFINGKYLAMMGPAELRAAFIEYLDYLFETGRMPESLKVSDEPDAKPPAVVLNAEDLKALRAEIMADPAYADSIFSLEPERHQKLSDIIVNCAYFFASTYRPASTALLDKHCPDAAKRGELLAAIGSAYDPAADHAAWEQGLRAIAAAAEVKDKIAFMLARVAVTGQDRTPPLYEIMHLLGPARVRERIVATG